MRSVKATSTQSLASLVVEPDEYILLTKMKDILDSCPPLRAPLEITELSAHLLMGSQRNAGDVCTLRDLGVTHVLNCAGLNSLSAQRNPYPKESGIIGYKTFPAEDQNNYDMGRHFEEAIAFINSSKYRGGRTLVHCNLGINRSGCICAAYLLTEEGIPLMGVLTLLKQRRGLVLCNKGFRRQLLKYARLHNLPITSSHDEENLFSDRRYRIPADSISLPGVLRDHDNIVDRQISAAVDDENDPASKYHSRPERFAHAYCTLPRKSAASSRSLKRQIAASHYDTEYFMHSIPEERTNQKYDSQKDAPTKQGKPQRISTFGGLSLNAFRKTKSDASESTKVECSSSGRTSASSLSTTRPLRVYRRSVTDSETYQKPNIHYTYKRAETVANCDLAFDMEKLSITADDNRRRSSGLLQKTQKNSPKFLSRFRPDKK